MDNPSKSSSLGDIIILSVFIVFLVWGGFQVKNAIVTLISTDIGQVEKHDKVEIAREIDNLGKSITESVDKFMSGNKTDGPKSTPAGNPKAPAPATGKILEVRSVKFFEAGKDVPALRSRTYNTQFSPQSRIIYTEIYYKHNNFKVSESKVPVNIQIFNASGQRVYNFDGFAQPKIDWDTAAYTRGWSPPDSGVWPIGIYTVKVTAEEQPIGEYKFEIK